MQHSGKQTPNAIDRGFREVRASDLQRDAAAQSVKKARSKSQLFIFAYPSSFLADIYFVIRESAAQEKLLVRFNMVIPQLVASVVQNVELFQAMIRP